MRVIPTLVCPSDSSNSNGLCLTSYGGANGWAVSNYGLNFLVFGNGATGSPAGNARIPASFPDGTSNTILFADTSAPRRRTPAASTSAWGTAACAF